MLLIPAVENTDQGTSPHIDPVSYKPPTLQQWGHPHLHTLFSQPLWSLCSRLLHTVAKPSGNHQHTEGNTDNEQCKPASIHCIGAACAFNPLPTSDYHHLP